MPSMTVQAGMKTDLSTRIVTRYPETVRRPNSFQSFGSFRLIERHGLAVVGDGDLGEAGVSERLGQGPGLVRFAVDQLDAACLAGQGAQEGLEVIAVGVAG